MSLFSVFDPVGMLGISFNWVSLIMFLLIFPFGYMMVLGRVKVLSGKIKMTVGMLMLDVSKPNWKGVVMMSMGFMMFIFCMNGLGLVPYIFTATSHLSITLGMGLVMWMSFFLMGWLKSFFNSAAHLVPEGSPLGLAPFMVMIEGISHLIRPITLSVRLAANMMAGHLIIGLISSMSEIGAGGFIMSILLQSMMLVLEIGVAIIQAFVFSILIVLYALEYY